MTPGFDPKVWAESIVRPLGRAVVWLGVPALGIAAWAWDPRGPIVAAAGVAVGLGLGARWRGEQKAELVDLRKRMAMYAKADAATDLDVVGPVTGETPAVTFYDQDGDTGIAHVDDFRRSHLDGWPS